MKNAHRSFPSASTESKPETFFVVTPPDCPAVVSALKLVGGNSKLGIQGALNRPNLAKIHLSLQQLPSTMQEDGSWLKNMIALRRPEHQVR